MNYIDQAIEYLNKLAGLPAIALVLISCVVLGYILRFIKRFPNDGIPVAVILWGAVAMMLMADTRTGTMTLRVWIMRNLIVGLAVGFAAWILHNQLLSRVEDWIVGKMPKLGDTAFFQKQPDSTQPPAAPAQPAQQNKP